jgi:acetyl-CoA carboxylase biotin carboxyl carrier protein
VGHGREAPRPAPAAPALKDIKSPMVGTFYRSPEPGAEPYAKVGTRVSPGQTVCIIEAMKIMNEIAADRAGVVEAILAGNGQPVEYGSPLMRLEAGRSDRA